MDGTIDSGTYHRMAPELINQWSGPVLIERARVLWGEECAWGVAFALRLEQDRLLQLLGHFRRGIVTATPGELLARRLVYTWKETRGALRKAWRESVGIRWQ